MGGTRTEAKQVEAEAHQTEHPSQDQDSRLGRGIARGAAIGIPVSIVLIMLAVWLITSNDIFDSFATALLPGVLLGVFGGGFVGMIASSSD